MNMLKKLKKFPTIDPDQYVPPFDYIYVVAKRKKHESDYNLMDIYGYNINLRYGLKLSSQSDLVDIRIKTLFALGEYDRLLIDYCGANIARYYFKNLSIQFKVLYRLSDFVVEIIKVEE